LTLTPEGVLSEQEVISMPIRGRESPIKALALKLAKRRGATINGGLGGVTAAQLRDAAECGHNAALSWLKVLVEQGRLVVAGTAPLNAVRSPGRAGNVYRSA
jgi:hypothetical protein